MDSPANYGPEYRVEMAFSADRVAERLVGGPYGRPPIRSLRDLRLAVEQGLEVEALERITDWVAKALALPGVFLLNLSPASALEAALLPSDELADPADRMLVAAARIEGARLVTVDRRIRRFAGGGGVRVVPRADAADSFPDPRKRP